MEDKCRQTDRCLSETDKIIVEQVKDVFREVDVKVEQLKALTGIHCPEMCGICCARSKVETTAIEMMPLAADLWEKNDADLWLERIEKAGSPDSCVFFNRDPDMEGNGRCSVYDLRPLICRLFGFYTVKDKNGDYVYGSCRMIKESYPEDYKKASELISQGMHPSSVTNYSIRLISIGSEMNRKMVPINTAAKIAIEQIGFEQTKRTWER